MIDAIDLDLHKYLREQDDLEHLADAIEDRASALFAGEYRHDTFAAISEAMGEASGETADAIARAAKAANLEALGRAVLTCSAAYWEAQARKKAAEEIRGAWFSCRCHGRGCSRCSDDQGE